MVVSTAQTMRASLLAVATKPRRRLACRLKGNKGVIAGRAAAERQGLNSKGGGLSGPALPREATNTATVPLELL